MPPTTRSHIASSKKVRIILNTKSRPGFMRKLPLELRLMVYKLLLTPRTIEVSFLTKSELNDRARAQAFKNSQDIAANSTNNTVQSKYEFFDDDETDADNKKSKKPSSKIEAFRFKNTSANRLVLHAINQETREFALKHYAHIFKTGSHPGVLFNFATDYLGFTTQDDANVNERKYQFVGQKRFQMDIARIQNMAYYFLAHHREMQRIHNGTPNSRAFVTRFPNLKKVIITLPLEHRSHCKDCKFHNGNKRKARRSAKFLEDGNSQEEPDHKEHIDDANNHYEELKQKMKTQGMEWVAPELIYKTHCYRQRWHLRLEDKAPKKSKS